MRESVLYQALESFTVDAASQLSLDLSNGEEVAFELMETEGRRGKPALYCYRPLIGEFVERRMGVLSGLTSYAPAVRALAGHERMGAYLNLYGIQAPAGDTRRQSDAVLGLFLSRVFIDRTEFEFDAGRFTSAYEELERTLLEGRCTTTVLAPLLGIALDATTPEIQLGEGLSLVPGDRFKDAPPEAVWGAGDEPRVLAVVTSNVDRTGPHSAAVALDRFRQLLTAVRLFECGTYAFGPMAWTRIDSGAWRPVAVGYTGRARSLTLIPARQEDELRAFCSLIPRRLPEDGEVAWALARYEMGCERPDRFQALSDYLMALRVLLEPEGPASGRMAQRLAMICAVPEQRARLAERAARAISLERAVIAGLASERAEAFQLVDEMAEHLRALLRDTVCGHLDADLVGVADRLLERDLASEEAADATAEEEPDAAEADAPAAEQPPDELDRDPVPDSEPVGAPA